jgi:LemA protein
MMELLKKNVLWVILGVVAFLAVITGGYYNSFVTDNNKIDGQWKNVEVQYQRRFDLIPNLVESAKGLMQQEQAVFLGIAEARKNYSGAQTTDSKVAAANQVESALSRLLVIMENYPELKSDATIARLQDELAGTENRVAVERKRYNDYVQGYNTSISTLPGVMFARVMGFNARGYFNAAAGAENAPQVKF